MSKIACAAAVAFLLAGCIAPIGVKRSSLRPVYAQMEENALSTGTPSASTVSILHRYGLAEVFDKRREEAVRQLHRKAVDSGDRDLLFALAEVSHLAGRQISRSVKPWDSRDPREYYLASAIYAYLYLFGQQANTPTAFDRRFRAACDFYNYNLGLALARSKDTNGVVLLESGTRSLPIGEIDLKLDLAQFPWPLQTFEQFLLGDQFLVRGLSVRDRQSGLGAVLIAVRAQEIAAGIRTSTPATAFLRFEGTLKELGERPCSATLELHSAFGEGSVEIAGETVPIETDISVQLAYALNQAVVWSIERRQFLSLEEVVPTQVYIQEPYQPGRIPVVFIHGTYSSPVYWAEMMNTLRADPVLRKRFQFWYFSYNTSAPVLASAAKFREAIAARIQQLDSSGSDPALQQVVLVGHSQGGLLAKLAATETDDRLWKAVTDKPIEEIDLTEQQRREVRRLFFPRRLECVRRVIFIATPHRGSYRARGLVQSLTRRLVSIPASLAKRADEAMTLASRLKLRGLSLKRLPTSVDGMSPRNPVLMSLAEIPVAPGVKAHSIIAVKGKGDPTHGSDGVVGYQSAHADYVESELVVRHSHSCQSQPETIEEVRRILYAHLEAQLPLAVTE